MTHSQEALERFDPDNPNWDALQRDLHLFRYEFAKPYVCGKRVLDVACGTGFGSKLFADAAAAEVVGVDCDGQTIENARRKYPGSNMQFETQDAEDLHFERPFDVVTSFETIEHLKQPNRLLAALPLILQPNGTFFVSSPVRQTGSLADKPANPFHIREWTTAEFHELLGSYFASVELFGQWMEFERGPFPLARTFKSWATAILQPRLSPRIHNAWPKPIESKPLFRIKTSYMVAVCTGMR